MPDSKIYNKVITIESKEEAKTQSGNTMVKLTDHTGERFTFFKKKQDGNLTSVAAQFRDMGLDEGSTVKIGYVIENYQDKNGITRESHKIINLQETNDNPVVATSETGKPSGEAPRASGEVSSKGSNDAFGRRLAVHGFVNGMLAAGATIETIVGDLPALMRLEDEIEKHLNPPAGWAKAEAMFKKNEDVEMDEPPIEAYDDLPY